MELQLCLSLSTYDLSKGRSHLNKNGLESKDIVSFQQRRDEGCLNKKRNFREAFDRIKDESQAKAFPLLVWSGQPNEEDDDVEEKKIISCKFKKNEAAEDHVVGWPPIKSWRKKLFHQHQGDRVVNINRIRREENVVSKSMYVKVKMEGVPITRKINLKLYNSYQALSKSLISMFAKCMVF
ncbi:hypothetical protein K2173_026115 [Erythroxylum novogranatense]|uniref:Auxin-responsive protein n=1 Tax=Erythroxylum novogranatense TaxID=1862640 RepID=A0AAV8SI10_9ROSI|nr:hypothetical protein K2173_026115 [Erythroxylum novogranatense]